MIHKFLFALIILFAATGFAQDAKSLQEAFQKSVAYENKHDYSSAIETLKPFASSTSYEVNVRLGWLYYSDGKFTTSVLHYTRAIALKPAATEPLWGIAYPLAELKKWTELERTYKKIISLDPKNTIAHYRLGLGAYYRKDYSTAKRYFDIVLNLYPLDYSSLLMSGWTNYFMGNKTVARTMFNKVLMVTPDDKSAAEGLSLLK
jgi:tetratricopeptide (TPR) repeat protein